MRLSMKRPVTDDTQRQPFPVLPDPEHFDPDLAAFRTEFLGVWYTKRPSDTKSPHLKVSPAPVNTDTPRRCTSSRTRESRCYGPSPRLVVGPDAINQLPAELERIHLSLPLIISSTSRLSLAHNIQSMIPDLDSCILDSTVVTVPPFLAGRDCVISVGGAAVSLARTVAYRNKIPHICIPTTYSGTELASVLSRASMPSSGRDKSSGSISSVNSRKASKMLPAVVIYDENLTDASTPTRYPATSDADIMTDYDKARHAPRDKNAQWSYLHLPGV